MIRREISQGINPIPASSDIVKGTLEFFLDGKIVRFPCETIPFTLTVGHCADRHLVEKYAATQQKMPENAGLYDAEQQKVSCGTSS